jgi:hypothetical protein
MIDRFKDIALIILEPVEGKPWLSGWAYRKKITIAGSTGAGTNYQVLLKVGESSGATGYDFHVNGHSASFPSDKNQGGDLRFTASDGTTLLDFWVESVSGTSPNRVAKVWVKVSADLGTNQDIYCYFRNPNATNVSNGDNTFLFFDDFEGTSLDTTKWEYYSGSDISVSNSEVRIGGGTVANPPNQGEIRSLNLTFAPSKKFRIKFKQTDTTDESDLGFFATWMNMSPYKYAQLAAWYTGGYLKGRLYNGSGDERVDIGTYSANTYYTGTVKRLSTGAIKVSVDGVGTEQSLSTDTWTDNAYVVLSNFKGDSGYLYCDWVFVSKFVDPEPAVYSAGSEEKRN